MAASGRLWPALIASGVGESLTGPSYVWNTNITGVVGGYYIFSAPLQEVSGKLPNKEPIGAGVSQAVKDGEHKSGYVTSYNQHSLCIDLPRPSSQPHTNLKYGGASPVDPSKPTVAGTTPDARRSNSADHNVKTRTDNSSHDGTGGGGVGVAEMRERKMEGRGLPSPQVSFSSFSTIRHTDEVGRRHQAPGCQSYEGQRRGRWSP
jgi:hypothetical protein